MNQVIILPDRVIIEIQGLDRIWSFKGKLDIERRHIRKAYRDDGKMLPPWLRAPGTALPWVIIAGTYYGKKRKEFWNFHFINNALVLDLMDCDYTRVVVDVDRDANEITRELGFPS